MTDAGDFLEGYAWLVHRAHREYLACNCFAGYSVFHSDSRAHLPDRWVKPRYTVQTQEPCGVQTAKAADDNLKLRVHCKVYPWEQDQMRMVSVPVSALLELLRHDDMPAFLAAAQDLWADAC